ncbi:hypothetical protein Lal_00030408 [Lupinus albus]|nr:hypothetical protein Lal_00030408 [Lupinus albus]
MLLRGKASEDQLQFNPEIEKSAKSNRKKAKAKKKQGVQLESQPSSSQQAPNSDIPSITMDDNSINTNNERTNPPRRTLGDYACIRVRDIILALLFHKLPEQWRLSQLF